MNKKAIIAIIVLLAVLIGAVAYVIINGSYFTTIHDVAIANVTVSTTHLHLGDTLNITVVAKNKGTVTETFNVTSYHNATAIGTQTVSNLAANSERNLSFAWNTTGASIANYVIEAEASIIPNEANATDNIFVGDVILVRLGPTGTETLRVDPPATTESVGQNFTININASSVTDLYGWEIKLEWNASVLEAENVIEGPLLKSGGTTFLTKRMNNTAGYVIVDCTMLGDVPGVSENGTLVSIVFRVKQLGSCDLSFSTATLVNSFEETITPATFGGSFSAIP